MDWDLAIKRNSKALKAIIEVLFALLGLDGTDAALRIPRSLHSAVLGVLRPAESAVRRLVVIAARNVVVKLAPSRPMPAGKVIGKGGRNSSPSFQLFDPPKRLKPIRVMKFTRLVPRIRFIEYDPRICALFPTPRPVVEPPPPPDGLASATRLHRRLQALKLALDNLPRQAERLVLLQQRRKASPWPKSTLPLRPGHPPGYRRKPVHEVDEVLVACDWLAWEAMKPDTS
ncbi:MAG: hypothetical protein Q7T14_11000 [Aestuariivirga sp.]|nr:hypothetical protein [Aestuariivirga sp.]